MGAERTLCVAVPVGGSAPIVRTEAHTSLSVTVQRSWLVLRSTASCTHGRRRGAPHSSHWRSEPWGPNWRATGEQCAVRHGSTGCDLGFCAEAPACIQRCPHRPQGGPLLVAMDTAGGLELTDSCWRPASDACRALAHCAATFTTEAP